MRQKETVTKVIAGDTFETDKRKNPVQLANVEVPEKGRRGAPQAREKLRSLIEGKEVGIETVARGKHGCSVARVYLGRESVNKKMQGG